MSTANETVETTRLFNQPTTTRADTSGQTTSSLKSNTPLNTSTFDPATSFRDPLGLPFGATYAILIVGACVVTLVATCVTRKVVSVIKNSRQGSQIRRNAIQSPQDGLENHLRLSLGKTEHNQPEAGTNAHAPSLGKHHGPETNQGAYTSVAIEAFPDLYANVESSYLHPSCHNGHVVTANGEAEDNQVYLHMEIARSDPLPQHSSSSDVPGPNARMCNVNGDNTYENSLQEMNALALTNLRLDRQDSAASDEGSDYVQPTRYDAASSKLPGAVDEYVNIQSIVDDCFRDRPKVHVTRTSTKHPYAVVDRVKKEQQGKR